MTSAPPAADEPWPILATAVVPWNEQGAFDADTFRRQVAVIARDLTRHIYIFGTAGEGHAVSERQFAEIAACFAACAREQGVRPMLGVISLSLATIIERIERGRALGYREFQLSLPAWGALNDVELATFFRETCGRFPECQFLHYNLARARRVLTAADYRRLVAAHPNLVAVKMSNDDPEVVRQMMELSPRLQFFFTEFAYARARPWGTCGLLVSLASAHPQRAREFVRGDDALRAEYVAELKAMAATLTGLAEGRFHMDGAFDHLLFRLHDRTFPLRLLPPYASADEAAFEQFRAALPPRWRLES